MVGMRTKMVALTFLAGTATAQADPGPEPQRLLSSLLAQAADLTASMANVAENLGRVDGSVVIQAAASGVDLVAAVEALAQHGTFGATSRIGSGVLASQISSDALDLLKPAQLVSGQLATTGIGALQSGALIGSTGTTGTVDTSGLADRVTLSAADTTAAVESFGSVARTVALQNVASNLGDVDASLQLSLRDVSSRVGGMTTTAIGAMESGMLTASLTDNMAEVNGHAAAIVAALVGP